MVSMKDIAAKCGVSVATVSKALNNQKDIGQETKKYVCDIAEQMGYMTNSAARALKTNRTFNIGVLFVDERRSGLAHEYFSSMLDSLKVEAEAQGYDITFINRYVGKKTNTYLQHCLYRGIDGVIIACVDFNNEQVIELVNSGVPVVTIDHVFNNKLSVLSNNVIGLETLTDYVYSKGHRRIAFIHGERTSVTEKRLVGFYRSCEKHGLNIPDEYVRTSNYHNTQKCAEITRELLALPTPPTCIMFSDDFSAMGGINEIINSGLRIPEDISVTGYDGINLINFIKPKLTTYRQNAQDIGKVAAAKLIELIEHPKTTVPEQILIEGNMIYGDSVCDLSQT